MQRFNCTYRPLVHERAKSNPESASASCINTMLKGNSSDFSLSNNPNEIFSICSPRHCKTSCQARQFHVIQFSRK